MNQANNNRIKNELLYLVEAGTSAAEKEVLDRVANTLPPPSLGGDLG